MTTHDEAMAILAEAGHELARLVQLAEGDDPGPLFDQVQTMHEDDARTMLAAAAYGIAGMRQMQHLPPLATTAAPIDPTETPTVPHVHHSWPEQAACPICTPPEATDEIVDRILGEPEVSP